MQIFDYDVFRECFHINLRIQVFSSQNVLDLVLTPATFIIGNAGLQLSIMQLSIQGYGPDQHFVIRKQNASQLCSLPETVPC